MMLPGREAIQTELLLLRCQRGERAGFEELVRGWELRLFYYIRRLVNGEQDAWDILQQTWVRVLRGIGGVRDPSRLAPWLYRVARNTALSHRRSAAVRGRSVDVEVDVGEVCDEREMPEAWEAAAVHAAMDKLTLAHREVLTLFFLQDLSIEQIAEVLEVPAGTIKSRLHYAKQAMRKVLEEQGVDHG